MLDTSIILLAIAWRQDLFSILQEWKLILPDCVREELELMSRGDQRRSRLARIALTLLEKNKLFKASCAARPVDTAVLQLAMQAGCLATADYPLARRAREAGVRVFILTRKGLRTWNA